MATISATWTNGIPSSQPVSMRITWRVPANPANTLPVTPQE
jgi:hypothetical protein